MFVKSFSNGRIRAVLVGFTLAFVLVNGLPAGAAEAGPVTITNCGATLTFETPPKRVLSFYPSMTELVIAIGAGDRVAVLGGQDAFVYPPQEVVLDARPDLIVADGDYYFDGELLPTRADLAELGIPVYLNSAYCPGHEEGEVTDAFIDIANLGAVFGATDAAGALLAREQPRLDAVAATLEGITPLRAVRCSYFEDMFWAEGGGLYTDILERVGATNEFTETEPTSVEAVLRLNLDAVVYGYDTDRSKTETEAFLRKNIPNSPAVRNDRLIPTQRITFAGELQSIVRVESLAIQLHPDLFGAT